MKLLTKLPIILSLALLTVFSFMFIDTDKASADGVRMPSSSTMQLKEVVQKYKAPSSVTEIVGLEGSPFPHFFKNRYKIYSTKSNLTGLIYGREMPFYLKDNATGINYPGYCAQSWVLASKRMSVSGLVTDPRLLKLAAVASNGRIENPAQFDHVAMQTVLWGALNENWAPNLFSSGKVSTKSSAYSGMQQVGAAVNRIAAEWSDIISDKEPKKPLIVKKEENKAKPPLAGATTTVVAVEFALEGGAALPYTMDDIATRTTTLPAGWAKLDRQADLEEIKKHSLPSSIKYEYFRVPVTDKEQKVEVTTKIKYVKKYAVLNEIAMAVYTGSSGNQPFLMPRDAIKELKYKVIIPAGDSCPPEHPYFANNCEEPDEPELTPPSSDVIPVRWHNMPAAFGEMKDGIGHNNLGLTETGTYAETRDKEEFEAMNGVPSTERFYVNLGGTEGFIDVKYNYVKLKQPFVVNWTSAWEYQPPCSPTYCPPKESGVDPYTHESTWEFKSMNLVEASFRVFNHGALYQEDLAIDLKIENEASKPGTFDLNGGKPALEQGPGAGSSGFIHGAENAWKTTLGTYAYGVHNKRGTTKSDDEAKAYAQANAELGDLFAHNDSLKITIQGKEYVIVPEMNKKTGKAFPDSGELDSTNGKAQEYFNPLGELWDVWGKIPVAGYTGNPGDDGERSRASTSGGDKTPIMLENYPIKHTTRNGIYEFEKSERGNTLDYNTITQVIKGGLHELHEDVSLLEDGAATGEATKYPSAKNPIDKEYYLEGNEVLLQYTNWQVPVKEANGFTFTHSGNKPDEKVDKELDDNPRYRSVNPILIHDPTSAQFAWVADIPNSELQDQRIVGASDRINTHGSVNDNSANNRLYVDYDFQLTIPDNATFNQYWAQAAETSDRTGFPDLDFTNPGTLGKYFMDTKTVEPFAQRYQTNPYLTQTSGAQHYLTTDGNNLGAIKTRNTWGIGKWVNAKYVKFPFDVYYYKNSGEAGGDQAGWYDAGDWIKLYDDMTIPSKSTDPTEFNFHVGSNTKDIKDGVIYVTSEAINAPEEVAGDAEALYLAGEQYINGTRNEIDSSLGSLTTKYDGEASHASVNQLNVDVIGRIGNLLVSDATDPQWNEVFWNTDSKGKIKTTEPVQKDYGLNYNMYETTLLGNVSGLAAFDRYKTIDQWHGSLEPKYTLPVRTNPVARGQSEQVIKLGYAIGGSIQTVGDYGFHAGSSMWIYPQNQLAGNFKTGNPSTPFKLVTSDPYSPGSKYMEYYDSKVNNTLHGESGILGKEYTPSYKHNLSASLADNRMKIGGWEKSNANYQKALQQGTQKKVISGTPSWIQIPLELRTEIGSHMTRGRFGNIHITPAHRNGNDGSGSRDDIGSCYCTESYENVHKWNWNYSLPQNTKVWFNNRTNASGSPIFEAPTKDQYIITSMAYRTKVARGSFPGESDDWQTAVMMPAIEYGDHYAGDTPQSVADWDLTMYTNTGVQNGDAPVPPITSIAGDDPTIGDKYPSDITPSGPDPSAPPVTTPDKWDPTQGGDIGNPMLDIVWWNYSKPATTDKDNIGTH